MGYDVHITRAAEWFDSETTPISREEWGIMIASDPALGLDPENGPDDFLFTGHPEEPWSLWWHRGRISTKDPDNFTIAKMIALAGRLGARVVGDEGAMYVLDATGAVVELHDAPVSKPTPAGAARSFWRRLLGR